jgi:hypothetical protein
MKIRTLLAVCSLALLTAGFAQEDQVPYVTPTPRPTPTPTPTPRPKKPTPTPEPPGKIEGMPIARGSGYLGIAVVGGNFKLTFYDAKKKPVAPDVSRAALRWPVTYKLGEERVVLNPASDGKSLTAGKFIRPPLTFKLYITLLTEGADEGAGETFAVDFRG